MSRRRRIVQMRAAVFLTLIVGCQSAVESAIPSIEPSSAPVAASSSATPSDSPSPAPSATTPARPSPSPTLIAGPTPVARAIGGRATLATTGAPVAGVSLRGRPSELGDGRAPGPAVSAVTDERGVYAFSVLTWTPADLAATTSFQLVLEMSPPPGFLVLGVTRSVGSFPGSNAFILADLAGPIDITLGPGRLVEGRITSGPTGTPLAGVGVLALGLDSMLIHGGVGDAFWIEARGVTDASGRYILTVPSGTYVIRAGGPDGSQTRFWSDDPAIFQATPLKIERDLAGIDLAVVPVTAINGEVRDGARPFAEGAAGIRVVAYAAACCRIVGVATTGCCGTFLMYLPAGTYRISVEPPAGSPYAAQWWRGAATFATATDVVVGPSSPIELAVELVRR